MRDKAFRKPFYTTLEGVRGIAATAVYIRHSSPALATYFYHSYLAVDLFFVLSGFVLAANYDQDLKDRKLSAFSFMRLRLIRLYPLFFLGTFLGLIASLLTVTYWGARLTSYAAWLPEAPVSLITAAFLFSLLMLPSIFSTVLFPLNDPAWTLFYEMAVNGFYALIRPYMSWRYLAGGLVICGVGIIFCGLFDRGMDIGFLWKDILPGFIRAIFAFAMGVFLVRAKKKFITFSLQQNDFKVLFIFLIIGALLATPSLSHLDPYYDFLAIFLLFPSLVLCASLYEAKNKYMSIFKVLGKCSYGLYILHVPISAFIAILYLEVMSVKINITYGSLLLYPCLLGGCFILDRYYDKPFRQWLSSILIPHSRVKKNTLMNY